MTGNDNNSQLQTTKGIMATIEKLGKSFQKQMSEAADSFWEFLSGGALISKATDMTKDAISDLKEIDSLLTKIGNNNARLSRSDLSRIGEDSLKAAVKYGQKASAYLSEVEEAFSAGYANAGKIAELSLALQNAGAMTDELSRKMIAATDKAFALGGSASKIREILDGINAITNNNPLDMEDFAEGIALFGSSASSLGIGADELSAALGTMSDATEKGASETAGALRTILLHVRQMTDADDGIDARNLNKYEKACRSLGVSLTETKDGILQLREPMQVLEELAAAYNGLDAGDARKTRLLDAVGSKQNAEQLDALLSNWSTYEEMLQQYRDGAGSMAAEAEAVADSWEGSLNRLSNTWTETIGHIAESDAVIFLLNGFNSLLSVIDSLSGKLGSLGTIGLGAGLFTGLKNVGSLKMFRLTSCFEYADCYKCSSGYWSFLITGNGIHCRKRRDNMRGNSYTVWHSPSSRK